VPRGRLASQRKKIGKFTNGGRRGSALNESEV
jgi:hypothetical protein